MGNARFLTSTDFDSVISSGDQPTLVDFTASWCGPCKVMAPIIDQLAGEYAKSLTVAKLDVDAESEIASRYQVMSVPTIILFVDGIPTTRFVGVRPIGDIMAAISQHTTLKVASS